jgi:hypothetical protein
MKFAILIDSIKIKKWQKRVIDKIISDSRFSLELIVVNENKNKRIFSFRNIFFYIYKLLFVRTDELRKINIKSQYNSLEKLFVETNLKGKYNNYFFENDINKIKSFNLDFILRFGFGIIKGEILESAKYGVWSYHHGDENRFRGAPYCFWEIYYNEYTTGTILQKLNHSLDAGIVLKRGTFKTNNTSLNKNMELSLKESSIWPYQVCIDIINNKASYIHDVRSSTKAPIYRNPLNYQMLVFIIIIVINNILRISKYFKIDIWKVGYIKKSIKKIDFNNIQNENITWIKQDSKKYYLADPFPIYINNSLHIFLEYYDYVKGKGDIFSYNDKKIKLSFSSKYHYSYPLTFQYNDKIYQIKESYEENSISIYELNNFKNEWFKRSDIVSDFAGIDSTILFYENLWWLFTTQKNNGHSYKLFIYYSENLFSDWRPHNNNPVKMNVSSSRGAGNIFKMGEDIFRPSQDYSISNERSIIINKIDILNKYEFHESAVYNINPIQNISFNSKIHTLSSHKDCVALDVCKTISLFSNPLIFSKFVYGKLYRKLRKSI